MADGSVRSHPVAHTFGIMVTAYGDEDRRRVAIERGAADFLAKPVDFNHLKRQLEQLAPQQEDQLRAQ